MPECVAMINMDKPQKYKQSSQKNTRRLSTQHVVVYEPKSKTYIKKSQICPIWD